MREPPIARQLISVSVFNVGSHFFELGENLREESRFCVDSQHRSAQLVDDEDTPIPKSLLVRFNQERFQRITDFIAHVTETSQIDMSAQNIQNLVKDMFLYSYI